MKSNDNEDQINEALPGPIRDKLEQISRMVSEGTILLITTEEARNSSRNLIKRLKDKRNNRGTEPPVADDEEV